MPELYLLSSFRFIVLLLAGIGFVALSSFSYRITIPPISRTIKFFLITLRSIGLFLLFFLISEPLLTLVIHSLEQPHIEVMVDNTQSMSIQDRSGRRNETMKYILSSGIWNQLKEFGTTTYSAFGADTKPIKNFSIDSLGWNNEETNIAKAFQTVQQSAIASNLQAVILLSDGNSTVGINPIYEAKALGIPVFTIGIGDTSEQKDILIRKVLTNEITYVGTQVPVHITVHSTGLSGERVQVSLTDGSAIADEKSFILEPGTREYPVQLMFTPRKEGMQKLTAEVTRLPGELTTRNNRFSVFTKVLKSKLQILLVSGGPSQDAAIIKRLLANDKNLTVKTFIEKKDGQFYEGELEDQLLNEADCIVIVGFPTPQSNILGLQKILKAVNSGKPLMTILSRTMDFTKLQILSAELPFNVRNVVGNEFQVFVSIPESQRGNPVLKIGSGISTVETWNKLPPIFYIQGGFTAKVESDVMATIRLQSAALNDPFIVARNVNKRKSLSLLGYGVWRWTMLSDAGSEGELVLKNFLSNAVRWLTTQEDARRIRVQAVKNSYSEIEAVEFAAQIYDENYQPIDRAQIEIRAQHQNESNTITMNSLENGQYQGTFDHLLDGDYHFTATVMLDGRSIGTDQGTFSVGGLNYEYLETKMNKPLLQQIAAQTGGKYYNSNEISSLTQDVSELQNFKPRDVTKSSEIEIWNNRWMLIILILAFTFEWFIRKRMGML